MLEELLRLNLFAFFHFGGAGQTILPEPERFAKQVDQRQDNEDARLIAAWENGRDPRDMPRYRAIDSYHLYREFKAQEREKEWMGVVRAQ